MTENLRADLLEKLSQVAKQQGRSLNAFVEDILQPYDEPKAAQDDGPPMGTLARLAWCGARMPSLGEPDNVSERVNEIMQSEFADYLLARMSREDHESDSD